MGKCIHENIIVTKKIRYYYPEGYYQGEEEEEDRFVKEDITGVFCEDCGKHLDE